MSERQVGDPNPRATSCDCGHGPLAHLRDSQGRAGYGRCCAAECGCTLFSTERQERQGVAMPTPAEAAIAVYRDAYDRHPVCADTYDTTVVATEAARRAGAGYAEASWIAIRAWDRLVAEKHAARA